MIEHLHEIADEYDWLNDLVRTPDRTNRLAKRLRREMELTTRGFAGHPNDDLFRYQIRDALQRKVQQLMDQNVIHDGIVQLSPTTFHNSRPETRLDVRLIPIGSIQQIQINVTLA